LDFHKKIVKRGYIAMLAVDSSHRKRKIGSTLVKKAIQAMIAEEADEVTSL
jgi:peptide alpha-N-acetyltransferase